MYRLPYSAALLLASFILSDARHTVFVSQNGEHTYLPSSAEPGICMKPKCVIEASDLLTSMDETVDPCDDFYRFACGGFLKRHEVSEDKPKISVIYETRDDLNKKLKELLESKYESPDPPFVKMLKDFYNACVDVDSIEKKGSEPLRTVLSRLGGWPVIEGNEWDESTFDWDDSLISFQKIGYDSDILIRLDVFLKSQNETIYIMHLSYPDDFIPYGSNLTLGLNDDKIAAYFKAMIKAAKLLGADETTAEKELLEVVHFMIALENSTRSRAREVEPEETPVVEDPQIYYTVKELQDKVPEIPWLKYFNGLLNDEIYENDTVEVSSMDFLTKLADLLTSTEKRVIANYMIMRAVLQSSEFLSEEWNNIYQEMKKLGARYGREQRPQPRWKICLSSLKKNMEIALSAYYVRHYFKDESKDEAIILMKYIHKEFLKILEDNDWMDEKTKEKAEEKAKAIKSYIGYPKELLNETFVMNMYENLKISADSHFENALNIQKMNMDQQSTSLRGSKATNNRLKFKRIVEVNAFYSAQYNSIDYFIMCVTEIEDTGRIFSIRLCKEIKSVESFEPKTVESPDEYPNHWTTNHLLCALNFSCYERPREAKRALIVIPAGILHDAFYEKERPNYVNFAAIGSIIGHEITHGFDNQGRHFDKDGNIVNWWDKDSDEHFTKKVQCIVDQYDNYTTDIGMKVNGEMTQNENIADNGGLKEAYWAYQSWTKDNGIEPLLPALNYTQNQLFWLSAANLLCLKIHPEHLKEQLLSDNHSPARYRIIGPMSNLEEFSKDFKCSADSPMNRKYKCKVW